MKIEDFSGKMCQIKSDLKIFAKVIQNSKRIHKRVQREVWSTSMNYRDKYSMHNAIIGEECANSPEEVTQRSNKLGKVLTSYQYRHLHVAYSLLRGRTMEEIEPKVDENNQLDLSLVEYYVEKYMGIKDFFKQLMEFRRSKPKVVKLYVLVREDMDPIHRAVQGGHAVAEFLQNYPAEIVNGKTVVRWKNGYMIYLAVKDEQELNLWEAKLQAARKQFATFVEPDWGVPTKTALACVDFGDIFADLPLLNMDYIQSQDRPVSNSLPCP